MFIAGRLTGWLGALFERISLVDDVEQTGSQATEDNNNLLLLVRWCKNTEEKEEREMGQLQGGEGGRTYGNKAWPHVMLLGRRRLCVN